MYVHVTLQVHHVCTELFFVIYLDWPLPTLSSAESADLSKRIDGVLERHRKMQDEIAEDMVQLARSIRHNSTIARDIILEDNKVSYIIETGLHSINELCILY